MAVAAAMAMLLASSGGYAQRPEAGIPEQSSSRAPATRGLDQELTAEALRRVSGLERLHTLLVARHGSVEIEHAAAGQGLNRPANIKSLSKTVLSALVGAAIDRDIIAGVDQPVVELLGDQVPAEADARVGEITVGHLLSMRAGLERTSGRNYGAWVASDDWVAYALRRPFVAEPGGRMLYSTGSSHLLSAALTHASGQSTLALAREWLGEPLGITIPPWLRGPQGIYFGGNQMRLSPRALLRFGELYRLGGAIDGERVLPASWIEASWTPRGRSAYTGHGYGYGWFMTRLAGEQVYYGRGYGGQMLYVLPGLAMTVVITSDPTPPSPGGPYFRDLNDLLSELLIPAARRGDRGMPAATESS